MSREIRFRKFNEPKHGKASINIPIDEYPFYENINPDDIPDYTPEFDRDITLEDAAVILGLKPGEFDAKSGKCAEVLSTGASCDNFIAVRRFILCYAWSLLEQGKTDRFKDAVDKAWAYARKYCSNI